MDRKGIYREFVAEALKREHGGLSTYGEFNPKTDTRILTVEAQEEALDAWNYLKFFDKKHPDLMEATLVAKRLTFSLYHELRRMERLELEQTPTKGGET